MATKKAVTEEARKAESAVKVPAAKAEETTKKETAVKAAPKAEKKTADKKPAAKKAPAKKAAAKAEVKKENVVLQFAGKEIEIDSVIASAKADFKANNKGCVRSINVYVKPEEDAAYYVVNGKTTGEFSNTQNLKTARMNFDAAGWEAMCRIVYHEVGQMDSDLWDKPIVYVSDCVVNRYVAAKYGGNNNWSAAYKNYSNIQSIIYNSGGFMSSAGLANDGAVYRRVPTKVKTAVYGAVYDIAAYKNIENDGSVYFWCNRSYYQSDSRIAYTFKIPWGYFNIWTAYWG